MRALLKAWNSVLKHCSWTQKSVPTFRSTQNMLCISVDTELDESAAVCGQSQRELWIPVATLNNRGFALFDDNNHVVSCLMNNSVVAGLHLRHHSCSDKSSELCLEAEVLNPLTGACFSMDAIHGKVGLPNFVLSQSGHFRQRQDAIDCLAGKPCCG